jgi:uncharacterized integral membrane protein
VAKRYSRRVDAHNRVGGTRKEGRGFKFWLFVIAAVLLAIFVIQNSQDVAVEFLFTSTDTPLFLALILAGVLGAIIGWAAPRVLRGGRD